VCVLALCVAAFPVEAHDHGKAELREREKQERRSVLTAKILKKFSTTAASKPAGASSS
jgi:hypothetical protein